MQRAAVSTHARLCSLLSFAPGTRDNIATIAEDSQRATRHHAVDYSFSGSKIVLSIHLEVFFHINRCQWRPARNYCMSHHVFSRHIIPATEFAAHSLDGCSYFLKSPRALFLCGLTTRALFACHRRPTSGISKRVGQGHFSRYKGFRMNGLGTIRIW